MAGLYKRGKTWWGRVQRGHREHRRSLKTSDKAIAERRLRKWVGEIDAMAWGEKPSRTFTEAAERFIREHLPNLKPQSARRYGVSIMHLIEAMGNKPLAAIGRAVMTEFETARRSQGIQPPTIRRDLACLSSIMGCAIDWEWIDVNPVPAQMKRRRRRGLKEAPPRTRYLSHLEEGELLSQATPGPRAAIAFAIDTGLRREEQFGLTWAQIDMARGRILLGRETKTGKPREVPFIGRTARLLAQLPRHIKSPYVFWHENGRRFQNMNKALKSAARRAGIGNLRWHDLRRTFGCRRLQDDGLRLDQVRELLGHESVAVTEKAYAFMSIDAIERDLTKTGTGKADSGSETQ